MAIPLRYWIIWMETKQESNLLRFRLMGKMRMDI